MLLGIKWYQFVRNDYVQRLTKQPKLTAIIRSRRLNYPVWAYYAHGRQRRCQEDLVCPPSGRLEKTTRSSPHHVAQHRPTGSETTPPYAPRKQQIWFRTSLCGRWCRRMALRNLKSCMPDDDDGAVELGNCCLFVHHQNKVSLSLDRTDGRTDRHAAVPNKWGSVW